MATSVAERRIDTWKQKLIDPSRRNRLLYFRPSKSSTLTISTPEPEMVFNRLVVQEKSWKFWLPPAERDTPDETSEEPVTTEPSEILVLPSSRSAPKQDELLCGGATRTILERTLKNIFRRARTDYQERGVRILYLGFGTLVWKEQEKSEETRSPLVLCPVELGRESARAPYVLSLAEEETILNPALQAKLFNDFAIKLPELPEDWDAQPLSTYFDTVARQVAPLAWTVETTAVLGLFSFHKLVMYQDLVTNVEHMKVHQVIRALSGEQIANADVAGDVVDERQLDAIQKPAETFQILDADSSQQQCIQAALQGINLVLQGPPGTGKSQTIANIIGEFIARGKTVLFVSEKMAALEVVSKRLSEVHLGEFALELHSHKANKREVVAELKRCLDEQLVPKQLPTPSDFETLQHHRQALNDYVVALHTVREPLGESVRDVLARLATLDDVHLLPTKVAHVEQLRPQRVAEWQELFKRLASVWHVVEEGVDFPWYRCRETAFTLETRAHWSGILQALIVAVEQLQATAAAYATEVGVHTPASFNDIVWIIEVGRHLNQSPGADPQWLSSPDLAELVRDAERYQKLCDQYLRLHAELGLSYTDAFFELPPGMATRLRQLWEETARSLAPEPSHERSLIEEGHTLRAFLEHTRLAAIDWQRDTSELLRHFEMAVGHVSLDSAQNIASLGLLCATETRPEEAWLNPQRLQETHETIRRIRPAYEEYRAQRTDLLTRYDHTLFELDLDDLIEQAHKYMQHPRRISLNALRALIDKVISPCLTRAEPLRQLAVLVNDLITDITETGQLLGFPTKHMTMEQAWHIGKLAELCGTEHRPEPRWLDPVRLQHVQQLITTLRPEYEAYNLLKKDILTRFDASLFELDVDRLIERFASVFYRAPLRWLHPGYYKDIKAIRATTHTHALPAALTDDLIKAREVQRMHKRLAPGRAEAKALFERYDREYATDFELIGRATEVVAEVLRLSGTSSLPTAFVNAISFGTVSSSQIAATGKRILDAVSTWETLAPGLSSIIALDDLTKASTVVSQRQRLDAGRDQVKTFLGQYDNGYDTDFATVERALKVATDVLQLAGPLPVPAGLVRLVTQTTPVTPDLAVTGARILDTTHEWEASARGMHSFLPTVLPWTALPLVQAPLAELEQWTESVLSPLAGLCELLDVLLAHHKHPDTADLSGFEEALTKHEELLAIQSHINAEAERLRRAFGTRFCGIATPWTDILVAIEWTQRFREICGQRPMSERLVQWATSTGTHTPMVQDLVVRYAHFEEQWFAMESRFEDPEPTWQGTPLKELSLAAFRARLSTMRARIDELRSWTDFKRWEGQCEHAGLTGFFKQLQKEPPPSDQLVPMLQKAIYQAWVTAIAEQDPSLKEFRGGHHEQVIETFKEVDQKLVRLASQRVVAACSARRPIAISLQAHDSEVSILRREAAKRRRHLSVRHLFDRIPNLLLKLKPCLFMSPLSVSQFLPPEKFKFDLVIFDEASQIFTEDAVGAIYRGRQLLVAGDSKQLPPTDFFKSIDTDSDDDDDNPSDEETSADFNSVLDECETIPGIRRHSLRWHYRSRHESLIAFSNHRFYESRLITFPSAHHHHKALGIELVHLPDGVYDRGGKRINQREAESVATRVFAHFTQYPRKSIGVVAFSQAQMMAIEDEIERRRKTNTAFEHFFREDRLEGFFVKNLENVQGDERDVIIFSIGYGRDQHGRMTMAFGPLNRKGGERRLNVAVTRAREKVVLISSIMASDIDLKATRSDGVFHLYHYLDYAARGDVALQLTGPQGLGEADSPFEDDVAGEIRALGYNVVPQVGCSGFRIDIGVIDPAEPGRFLLGVECDGATYHSAATARDRDRLRQQILEQLGWRIHRIWSPDWVTHREGELRRLKQAIEEARCKDGHDAEFEALASDAEGPPAQPQASDVERVVVVHPDTHGTLPGTVSYEVYKVRVFSENGSEFHFPRYREEQSELLAEVVRQEGPIHIDLATKRVLAAWGLTRAGARITDAMAEAISRCIRMSLLEQRGEFLWPTGVHDVPVRVPESHIPETYRDVAHIPSEEIQACMLLIIRHAVGIGVDSLIRETANVFGFNRTGNRIRDRLREECEALQHEGTVTNVEGSLSCTHDA